jgi:hypothetical protein
MANDIALAHAKLSASGSKKWLTCTRSASLEAHFPDESSDFAAEGTLAHAVGEQELARYLGLPITPLPADAALKYDTPDLRAHVAQYVARAIERIEEARAACPDAVVLLEKRLDFSPWVPDGFGTGDLVIVAEPVLDVGDLKFGKGIPVSAIDNSQMRLYALGAVNELGHLYGIERVRMTIYQPRLDNYSTEEISVAELLAWAADVAPRAQLAWDGQGEFVAGEHCKSGFCKARFTCAARAEANLSLARSDFALVDPETLTTDQLCKVLSIGDQVSSWIADVQAYALQQAEAGAVWPGFKLVEGRSNRKISDPDGAVRALVAAGIPDELLYERSLLGLTKLEVVVGKKRFGELVGDFITKPAGKPTLVPDADKRTAISSGASAATDFQ